MQFQPILDEIAFQIQRELAQQGPRGQVARYIPALARVDAAQFGIALRTCDGQEAVAGDGQTPFSIQSISKVFTLTLAMRHMSEQALWARIGREPSGNPFNSLVQLEFEQGTPRNPFINAGAIAVADRIVALYGAGAQRELCGFMSHLAGEPIAYDEEVAASEAATGYRNHALANFMKSFGRIDHGVQEVLDLYFHQCALRMSCLQLARAAGYLCRDGAHPLQADAPVVSERQARRINALMLTCGTYDAAGEFAFRIGLPCKSGVGGGIVAVVPDRLTLAVWSPALDETGNSLLGMKALELFTTRTGLSVF
ncbi:glutaminase [Xenophilus arseniciresistens]|uniref:Glutaminase n=1 Tax=Xenophilus arseniciresistens TaxID=1283306 RepID=A0AAE3T1A9_9BURK|nr:glutaminase [Xenophilus arseniciresistens]MDA7419029.1 glutaminase [Xenophilus arseniciresistens]